MAESASYARRGFLGGAAATTLASGVTAVATTITVIDASTWAGIASNGPFRFTIDEGGTEEECEATGISSNDLTGVTRGVGGTSAAAHDPGVSVTHTSSVRDLDEANYWVAELGTAVSAAEQVLVSDADNSLTGLAVAASRIVGRKSSGSIAALTVAELVTLLQGTDLAEYIADTVGAMLTGNTETGITVDYQDADNTIDFVVTASSIPANDAAIVETSQTTTSTSPADLATSGPAVTVTTGTKALVLLKMEAMSDTASAYCFAGVAVSGASTVAANAANSGRTAGREPVGSGSHEMPFNLAIILTGLTAGSNTFTAKYWVSANTGTFASRRISVVNMGS